MFQVVGYQYREYRNKQNKLVQGYNVYGISMETASPTDSYVGRMVEIFWLSPELYEGNGLEIGDVIEVYYNKFGRLDRVRKVQDETLIV